MEADQLDDRVASASATAAGIPSSAATRQASVNDAAQADPIRVTNGRRRWALPPAVVAARWASGKADENVEPEVLVAEELQVLRLDDLDAAIALGESVALLRNPRRGDEDPFRCSLVCHDTG
jgi:hypothetical protein